MALVLCLRGISAGDGGLPRESRTVLGRAPRVPPRDLRPTAGCTVATREAANICSGSQPPSRRFYHFASRDPTISPLLKLQSRLCQTSNFPPYGRGLQPPNGAPPPSR